jgi:hypothetical protein
MKRFLATLAFSWGVLAFAQGDGSIPTDIPQWFASTASLAAVVAALVALIRKYVLKSLEGVGVLGVSLVLSLVLAFVGKLTGYLGGEWLTFGLGAFAIASGGTAYIKSMAAGSADAKAAGDTRVDAGRDRLR